MTLEIDGQKRENVKLIKKVQIDDNPKNFLLTAKENVTMENSLRSTRRQWKNMNKLLLQMMTKLWVGKMWWTRQNLKCGRKLVFMMCGRGYN